MPVTFNGIQRVYWEEFLPYTVQETLHSRWIEFPKRERNSVNSAKLWNLTNHWSMNWWKLQGPLSHLCLAVFVIVSWSVKQQVSGLNKLFLQKICHRIQGCARFGEFCLFFTEQVFALPLYFYEKSNQGAQIFFHANHKNEHSLVKTFRGISNEHKHSAKPMPSQYSSIPEREMGTMR